MNNRKWYVVGLVVGVLAVSGCSRKAGYYPVYGKVTYKGEPAAGATVYFHRTSADGAAPTPPMAVVQSDGSFELTGLDTAGAPPGSYNVLVEWRSKSPGGPVVTTVSQTRSSARGVKRTAGAPRKTRLSRTMPPDRLNGRYFAIEHPLLKAEVKPESNTLPPFELVD
jgi:hypothetical protein